MAIWGQYQGSDNNYIADNVIIGRNNPKIMIGVISREVPFNTLPGYPPKINSPNGSYYAITVAGQGHAVCHSNVANFFDGICTDQAAGSSKEAKNMAPHSSIDFYNNYISNVADNCIETDTGTYNIRILRNANMMLQFAIADPCVNARLVLHPNDGSSIPMGR